MTKLHEGSDKLHSATRTIPHHTGPGQPTPGTGFRFSELLRRAASEGPQIVTRHGREAAVVLGVEEYRRLAHPGDLVSFLADSPLAAALQDGELVLERSREPARDVGL